MSERKSGRWQQGLNTAAVKASHKVCSLDILISCLEIVYIPLKVCSFHCVYTQSVVSPVVQG